ncbi:MAG: helix-turn-helix domain-containing protein [Saprospiraceae bacterium]|nr:helix-turn-helix domain-containing protein [Saprospiraceae bacterium]
MEFIVDQIHVPNKRSFIARNIQHGNQAATRVHSHKNFELNFITSGSGRRIVGNNISSYEPGDLVLLGPNLAHCWEVSESDREMASCIVIHFYENIINSDFFNIPELEKVVELLDQSTYGLWFKGHGVIVIQEKLEELINLQGLESYIVLLEIFNQLLNIKDVEELSFSSSQMSSFKKDLEKINLVYEYVFNHIESGINLEDAAAVLNMAPGSFCRYFKKKTNQTFMEYVKSVRIGIAARMLSETDMQITRICYESGYNSLANFNSQFKLIMGKSPSDYRNCFR